MSIGAFLVGLQKFPTIYHSTGQCDDMISRSSCIRPQYSFLKVLLLSGSVLDQAVLNSRLWLWIGNKMQNGKVCVCCRLRTPIFLCVLNVSGFSLCCRWLVIAVGLVRAYLTRGSYHGLYYSIEKPLKFFQTGALLEVSGELRDTPTNDPRIELHNQFRVKHDLLPVWYKCFGVGMRTSKVGSYL